MVGNEGNPALNLRARRRGASDFGPQPRMMLVAGASAQQGVTTVALNVAASLVDYGARVVLANLDLHGDRCGIWCQLTGKAEASGLLAGRQDIHEFMNLGPSGLLVIPHVWPLTTASRTNIRQAVPRLVANLQSLGRHADWVVVDLGDEIPADWQALYGAASAWCFVSRPEPDAVTETYALIKWLSSRGWGSDMHVVLNRVDDREREQAEATLRNLRQSCRQFLSRSLGITGVITDASLISTTSQAGKTLLSASPTSATAQEFLTLTQQFLAPQTVYQSHPTVNLNTNSIFSSFQ